MKSRGHWVAVCLGIVLAGQGCAQILGFGEEPPPISNAGGAGGAGDATSVSGSGIGGNGGMAGGGPCPPDVCDDDLNVPCKASDCTVSAQQSAILGSAEHQTITAMAAPGNGEIVIGGNYAGSIDLGNGIILNSADGQIHPFMAKLGSNGVGVVAYSLGESGATYDVAADPTGTATYGTGIIDDPAMMGEKSIFIQKFGVSPWTHVIGKDIANGAGGIARGGSTQLYAAAYFKGNVTPPNCPGFGAFIAETTDSLVMQFNEVDGACTWATKISNSYARTIDVAGNRVVVGGFYSGLIDLPNAPMTDTTASFLVVYDATTHMIQNTNFLVAGGGGGIITLRYAAFDPVDKQSVYIIAKFRGFLEVNGKTLVSTDGGTDIDMIVAKYDPTGNLVWINRFGGVGEQLLSSITPFDGNIFIAGTTAQNMAIEADTDSGPLCSSSKCMFLLKLSADTGAPLWGRAFGTMEMAADATGVSAADTTNFWLGGGWSSAIDFGAGALMPQAGAQDIVFAKFGSLP